MACYFPISFLLQLELLCIHETITGIRMYQTLSGIPMCTRNNISMQQMEM